LSQTAKSLATIGVLLLAITYLAVRGATPDAARHEQILSALRLLILNEAALHRDVLRARDGLLRDYDPIVHSVDELHDAGLTVESLHAGTIPEDSVRGLRRALDDQESLVEAFKSYNSLLQNSLSYFGFTIHQLNSGDASGVARSAGVLASEMLRFTGDAGPDNAARVTAALDGLARAGAQQAQNLATFVRHGRLIVATLPALDGIVGRLLASPVAGEARIAQDLYLERHGLAVARANLFRIILYAVAMALAAYLGHLFLRLRASARSLRKRLGLENLIAGISTQFINLPRQHMADAIRSALARLAGETAADRAYLIQSGQDGQGIGLVHHWPAEHGQEPAEELRRLFGIAWNWRRDMGWHQHCIYLPSVASMPAGAERSALAARGINSWLCLPLRQSDRRLGILGFEAVSGTLNLTDEDIALFSTAGQIFANALERNRTESENEALQVRLRRTQRLEAIGTLTGGIAHNFRNMLGAILGYSEMALEKLAVDSQPGRYVREVQQAGLRAKAVIDQMLTFGRRTEHARRLVSMQEVAEGAIRLLRGSLPSTVTIQSAVGAAETMVLGDATQLEQIVLNLCTNAAHAIDDKGIVLVELDLVELAQGKTLSHGALPAGRYVRLTVTDSGHGIDPGSLERIFEPFFTTKPAGTGTGLGLATVHGIVADHGGALNVQSQPGVGSRFEAYLAAAKRRVAGDEEDITAAPIGSGETVLIVEDDTPLRHLQEEMVAALGYEPIGFSTGREALAEFQNDPARIDLVLTDEDLPDEDLPEMSGTDLAEAMHRVRPGLPVVLVTGQAALPTPGRMREAAIRQAVQKPLTQAILAGVLARHMQAERRPSAT
jgi:signal transduction histidine kinase